MAGASRINYFPGGWFSLFLCAVLFDLEILRPYSGNPKLDCTIAVHRDGTRGLRNIPVDRKKRDQSVGRKYLRWLSKLKVSVHGNGIVRLPRMLSFVFVILKLFVQTLQSEAWLHERRSPRARLVWGIFMSTGSNETNRIKASFS